VKRIAIGVLLVVALLTAHVFYWYVPRERAAAPRLPVQSEHAARRAAGGGAGRPAGGEPLQVLAAGDYDVCLWVPYPHQNLGALAAAIGDLGDVVGAAARLTSGGGGEAAPRPQEPEEAPTFGPFEVPPANEMVACSDLAGGRPRRLRVVARIYPVLAVVAKLAGRLAGNPWLAGGTAGPMRIAWEGRLWSVTSGPEVAPATAAAPGMQTDQASPASRADRTDPPSGAAADGGTRMRASTVPAGSGAANPAGAGPAAAGGGGGWPDLPASLAVVHWTGARQEIPAGYYALTRSGSDLTVSLMRAGGGAGGAESAVGASAALAAGGGSAPSLLVAVGPEWRGAGPFGGGAASGGPVGNGPVGSGSVGDRSVRPAGGSQSGAAGAGGSGAAPGGDQQPLPPAALALFETGGSRLSSLGDLPGLAVFNGGPAGAARWRLPTEGIFRLLARRLPASEVAGWKILALDPGSLRQAEALAPRLAALVPPLPAGAAPTVGAVAGAAIAPGGAAAAGAAAIVPAPAAAAPAGTAGGPELSLGLWLEPRSALRIVSRIRQFVEKFPLASRRQVELWRDWETVLDPLANCDHAALTATAAPASMRLLLQNCTASVPH
jgi:hypothetical protein